jgi:tetratricopeptide (TPR) repeat protein
MKKLLLILLLIPVITFGQKAPKPNTKKILSLYQEGKYKEAKEQADITVADPKIGTDGYAWYYRGLVYATLDTIPDAALHSLDPDPLKVAVESFKKAEELNKKKDTEYFTMAPGTLEPVKKTTQLELLSNYYLAKSIKLMQQDEPDYEGSYAQGKISRYVFENTLEKYGNDTLAYYVQSLAALNNLRYDSSAEAALKYLEKGGKSSDIYLVLFQIYNDKGDKVKALEVAKEARAKFPFKEDFAKNELSIYLSTKQYDAAKAMVEEQIQASPSPESYYMLGELNRELKNIPDALKAFKKAVELDVNHFDSNASLAELTYQEVLDVRKERDATKDIEKRRTLYAQIEKEFKETLPYWERLESLKPNDENVLYYLQSIYNDLTTYDEAKYTPKLNKLKAKMKALGLEVD